MKESEYERKRESESEKEKEKEDYPRMIMMMMMQMRMGEKRKRRKRYAQMKIISIGEHFIPKFDNKLITEDNESLIIIIGKKVNEDQNSK